MPTTSRGARDQGPGKGPEKRPQGFSSTPQSLRRVGLAIILLGWLATACTVSSLERRPPPDVAPRANPSFSQDIRPILDEFCVKCHQARDAHQELRLDNYEGVMRGSERGPVVIPGKPQESQLLKGIKRETPPGQWMPFHQEPLTPNRILNIERWILQGALNN